MQWNEQYPKDVQPSFADVEAYINNPLWRELCGWLEDTYGVSARLEHSVCSGAPGWNIKYKKSGRALCTLYPNAGSFTALVCIGRREQTAAELLLPGCCASVQALYERTKPFNGSRWLMIEIADRDALESAKLLIGTRAG